MSKHIYLTPKWNVNRCILCHLQEITLLFKRSVNSLLRDTVKEFLPSPLSWPGKNNSEWDEGVHDVCPHVKIGSDTTKLTEKNDIRILKSFVRLIFVDYE